ncbi:hypothetical protein EPH_0032230 [Eimeria praecox]|uniref:Uncharacterized protein n=1 Tax=Eimeria praecox TaxID=51316 RepID=U6GAV5_9EIME|nr:hypothetical protein EPH_0032230 [Eimeria praecox]
MSAGLQGLRLEGWPEAALACVSAHAAGALSEDCRAVSAVSNGFPYYLGSGGAPLGLQKLRVASDLPITLGGVRFILSFWNSLFVGKAGRGGKEPATSKPVVVRELWLIIAPYAER